MIQCANIEGHFVESTGLLLLQAKVAQLIADFEKHFRSKPFMR
jgi:hypothetical protein